MNHRHLLYVAVLCISLLTSCSQTKVPDDLSSLAGKPGISNTYLNPLPLRVSDGALVESCADPSVIRGQTAGDTKWYMYCTTDPLNSNDRDSSGNFNFRLIPMFSSPDLVNWTYEGDAFEARPSYAVAHAGLWAPEIAYYPETGKYHLYYTVTDTTLPDGGSAIGVATSDDPLGPWLHHDSPVVEPHAADCCPGSRRWVFDQEVLRTDGPDYIYYGSYFGGVSVRELSKDGFTSYPATQTNITIPNRYEGAEVAFRDGYYYLFVSATDCCRGPLTGYSIFAGRSPSPTGPFVDREGISLLNGRVGGTPVLSMNGNRWVGPGHNTVFQDFAGQWWTIYHAVNRFDPYFEGAIGFTKRPALLDPLDWVDGWPTVRAGSWASDIPQQTPAAQPRQKTNYKPAVLRPDQPGTILSSFSDEFAGTSPGAGWTWVREPSAGTYGVANGMLRFDTQAADLFESSNNASVLTRPAPSDNYLVEVRVRLNLPPEGCCFNYVQAGLVVYGDDDNYLKLVHVSIWETRQTEWAKEEAPVPAGYPRYGNTVVSAPGEWTYLRVVKRTNNDEEHYTAYTSRDGTTWNRGGTWTHRLGANARLGLVSMGGSGFTAKFDYVRVYSLNSGKKGK
jgi:arabinan endo-1,5-alpha-L-arabinosidase